MEQKKITKKFWIKLVSAPILMFAFAYAMVPIYTVFCEITGFNGTTGRIDSEQQYAIDENRKAKLYMNVHWMVLYKLRFLFRYEIQNGGYGRT
jgi:cytochrome c oxidase assembly protein subunit 11